MISYKKGYLDSHSYFSTTKILHAWDKTPKIESKEMKKDRKNWCVAGQGERFFW
jgi:hypothetical protein